MGLFDFLKRETESDHDAAIRLYDVATKEYSAKRYAAAVALYEQAWSKDPDVNTFFNLSVCYYFEWGTTKNEVRCFELTRHAALKGNSQAMNNLGFFYNTGYGCTEDKAEGRKWIEKSAKLLNLSACRTLAHIYHDESETNPPVLHDCYTQLKICADKNYNDTQQLMADWFGPVKEEEWKGMSTIDMSNRGYDWMTGGNGFTKNLELAKRCLRAAADRGDGAACCNLGWCYDQEGKSDKANEVYLKGANLNCTTAMLNLARNLHNGRGWPKDDSGARLYLKMAHDAGDKRAAERLAEFFPEDEVREQSKTMTPDEINNRAWAYMKGFDGQDRDVKKAALWFDVAATKGLVAAWYGKGTALDEQGLYSDALAAYTKGAEQGNANCMYIVGTRYADGTGCTSDMDTANEWLLKAHEAGDQRAMDKIKELNPTLERDCKVQFMLDNMRLCVEENFSSDEYDVEAMVYELINDEDYETARELTRRCLLETEDDPDELSCQEDMQVYLAHIYYEDGDGNDDLDCPFYRLRQAHPLVVDLSYDFEPYRNDAYMWLATLFSDFFTYYEDAEVNTFHRHRDCAWYGRQAYKYNLLAAKEGYYMAMYRTAMFLLDGEVVDADYDEAYSWLEKCKDHCNGMPLYRLGNMHYYSEYGRENRVLALKYYEAYKEQYEADSYYKGMITQSYAQALTNLAHLLLQKNTSIADSRARSMLEKVTSSSFHIADALYGYMLYEGRGGRVDRTGGLNFMRQAANDGDPMAEEFLRNYGY